MKKPKYFIEVYKSKGESETYTSELLPIYVLEDALRETTMYKELETVAIFKVTPKTK